MRVFYGDIFIEKEDLQKADIWHPIKLEYYKIISQDKNIYGIDVVKKEYIKNEVIKEEKEMKHLSYDETQIDKILKLFKKNVVTPITAQDIADDLLKQEI
ncbi:MAG: hypothetical protein IKF83_03400 [Clostridia bacterium]|nr:hypothetical protein [Clostridia bacterium]